MRHVARPGGDRGLTLTELAASIAVAGVVIAAAMAATSALSAMVWPQQQGLKMKPRINALAQGVAAWYRHEHCGGGARPVLLPADLAHEPVAATGSEDVCKVRVGGGSGAARDTTCLARHLPPGARRLLPPLATAPLPDPAPDGWFDWEIVSRPLPPSPRPADWRWSKPRLRLLWTPPEHVRERAVELGDVLARELGAYCDDDGNADTPEACDGEPPASSSGLGERFVWTAPLGAFAAPSDEAIRQRRLTEWLALNAVDCARCSKRPSPSATSTVYALDCVADLDGVVTMDRYCDGPTDNDRIDAGHVIDVNGDGCDDARPREPEDPNHPRLANPNPDDDWPCHPPRSLLDGNDGAPDGRLDFDATEDFVVDANDYRAIGC